MLTASCCRCSMYSTGYALDVPSQHSFEESQRRCCCRSGLWGKGDLSSAEKLLHFVGWRLEENGTPPLSNLSSQALSKIKKNGEMFHVSCLFLPKARKKRAKESWYRNSDIPREDVAGMKACHFVRDDHETAPFFPFFETDFVRIWRIYCFCFALPLETGIGLWNGVFTSQSNVSFWYKWQEAEEREQKVCNQPQPTVFIVVLAQRGITNWSFQKFRPLILMKLQQLYFDILMLLYTRSAVSMFCVYFRL